ncbi:MAG: hypothetical protein KY469_10790 [Actinobacteria bacterium]|nr:hypothetical protein [Actinomycetota bacterium]
MTNEQFHHRLDDGREIVLPHMRNIKAGLIRKVRRLSEADQTFTILEAVADDDVLAIIDDLKGHQLEELMEAWEKASVSLGESSASTGS